MAETMVVFSLTLVRHGETIANKEGKIQGHQDVALSDLGLNQAHLVAFRLRNEKFTHIFASDLNRAARTAQIIADGNTVCHCPVIKDQRLRERRFGIFEGRTFKELYAAAQKSNKKWADFNPEGAETYEQVRDRAKAFFQELCEKMLAYGLSSERNCNPNPANDTQSSLSTSVDGKSGRTACHTPDRPLSDKENETNIGATTTHFVGLQASAGHPGKAEEVIAAKRPRTEEPQLHRLSLEGVGHSADVDTDCAFGEIQGAGTTTIARSNSSSSSGCSSLHDSVECPEADVEGEERGTGSAKQDPCSSTCPPGNVRPNSDGHLEQNPFAGQSGSNRLCDGLQPWVKDTDPLAVPGSVLDPSLQTCPNVSLSPLLEHRLTPISSVSSGRNSSFDDADIVPSVTGDVLIATHGGFIKEMVSYFIEDLNCKIPGGKGHALRVCPNTGVSRFMVTLNEGERQPTVTCLLIHDKEHLKSLEPTSNDTPAV
ncbi:uncharacterized protein LOC143282745 [Babylonia areolata]|uniref:uncharacterized protein LOC143282745 n=1 Tax=Babylonia areolata TaxID=304850 RepID=UPI003FCFE53F